MSQQPDTAQPNTALASNDLDLTDAETAALAPPAAEEGTSGEPAAPAAAADAGTAAAAPDDAAAAPADEPAAAGVGDAAAATGAADDGAPAPAAAAAEAATAPATAAPPSVFVPTYADDGRDFDAELAANKAALKELRDQHGSGEIEDDEYERRYEELQDTKTDLRIAQSNAKTRAELSQQNADQSWNYLQNQFFADAANAAIRANGILFAAWEAGMQEVVNEAAAENRQVTDWDLMVGARAKLVAQGMLPGGAAPAATPAAAAAAQPKPDRTPPLGNVPQGLSGAPSAAEPGTRTTSETLADIGDIEDIEATLAGKSEAERDAILRGTPGAFLG